MTEKLGNICSDVLNAKENETMEREKIIELVKALGITAEELGIKPEIKTVTERDDTFIREVRKLLIGEEIDDETARTYFREEYWSDLNIEPRKYKIVKCQMEKVIYKNIYVAMPQDEDIDNVDKYIGYSLDNLDTDYPDDEEDWELYDTDVDEDELTEEEVNNRGQDEIWNYNDFAE